MTQCPVNNNDHTSNHTSDAPNSTEAAVPHVPHVRPEEVPEAFFDGQLNAFGFLKDMVQAVLADSKIPPNEYLKMIEFQEILRAMVGPAIKQILKERFRVHPESTKQLLPEEMFRHLTGEGYAQ